MSKILGEFHKLRLLRFDSKHTNKSNAIKRKMSESSANIKKKLKVAPDSFVTKCAKWMRTKSSSETFWRSKIIKKRISSVFKPSNQLKRPIIKRSTNLYDLQKKISKGSCRIVNKTHQILQNITSKSSKSIIAKEKEYNNKDVRVLYRSNTKNSQRYRNNIHNDVRNLNWIYNSKSSNPCYFESNQQINRNRCQMHNNNNYLDFCNDSGEIHCNNNTSEFIKDPRPLRVSISEFCTQRYDHIPPCPYNLDDFTSKTPRGECFKRLSHIDYCPHCNKSVGITTSCFDNKTNIDHILKQSVSNCHTIKNMNKNQEIKSSQPRLSKCQKRDQNSIANEALKYILFVLSMILWSPCILVLCLCWLLTYPVRPDNISKETDITFSKKYRSFFNILHYCGDNFRRLFTIISEKVQYTSNNLDSMIKKRESYKSSCLKPYNSKSKHKNCVLKNRHTSRPDPRRKYSLYYSRRRGWVMKPYKKCARYSKKHFKSSPTVVHKDCHDEACQSRLWLLNHEKSDRHLEIKCRKTVSFEEANIPECGNLNGLPNAQSTFCPTSRTSRKTPCRCIYKIERRGGKHLSQRSICPKHGRREIYTKNACSEINSELLYPTCENKKELTRKGKFLCWYKCARKNVGKIIDEADSEAWNCENNIFVYTLKQNPCPCVHKLCPSFYPYFISFCKFYEHVATFFLFIISTCIWFPAISCFYFCFSCFCRCI